MSSARAGRFRPDSGHEHGSPPASGRDRISGAGVFAARRSRKPEIGDVEG